MKRIWSLLVLALLIPCLILVASAEETSGTCGDNLTWVFEDTTGILTISGTGEMHGYYHEASDPDEDWYYSSAPWPNESLKTVIIEEGVTSIGSGAFLEAYSLSEVTLPKTLSAVEKYAFYNCSSLTGAFFWDSLTYIGKYAFAFCYHLDKITLPGNALLQIEDNAFTYSHISTVEIPAGLTSVPVAALQECYLAAYMVAEENPVYCGADGILFSKDMTKLISCPRSYCFDGQQYTVPGSVKTISEKAFFRCSGLQNITIPGSVETIGSNAFEKVSSINAVYAPNLEEWLQIAFESDTSNPLSCSAALYLDGVEITDLVIPEGITAIGNYAFTGMKCSGSLTLPDSLNSIGISAFDFCYDGPEKIYVSDLSVWMKIQFASNTSNPMVSGADLYVDGAVLTEVVVPDGITSVGDFVFSDCDTLTGIVLPDSVISIGKKAFWDCDGLVSVSVPDSVTAIGEGAFERCSVLTDIHIPKGLKAVNDSAFSQCSVLTSVTLPDTVTRIGDYAFYQCSALSSVNIPEAVTYIGYCAFRQCRQLTSVTVPDAVTEIGANAFAYCSGIRELKLGTGLTKLGGGAFLECKRIKELNIPGAVGTVPKGVAENCVSLEKVTLDEGITLIDYEAFAGCTKLKSISFPSTLKRLFREAFEDCESLTDFYLQTINTWIYLESLGVYQGEYVDYEDTCYSNTHLLGNNAEPKNLYVKGKKVTNVVIPADVDYLVDYMFYTTTIESVVIPGSVAIVPEYAFSNCASLERVVIGPELEDIDEYAFKGCKNLKTITLPDSMYYIGENAFAGTGFYNNQKNCLRRL